MPAAQLFVIEFTTISLVIQWVGVLVVGGLLLFLTQSIRRRFLDDWTAAWCCLIVALGALYLDFRQAPPHHFFRAAYFLAEYAFGYLLVAGCRDFATAAGTVGASATAGASGAAGSSGIAGVGGSASASGAVGSPAARSWRWLLPAGAALALALTWVSDDFNVGFAVHAAIVAAFLLAACWTLLRVRGRQGGPGLTVMCVTLGLLALDFCHYVPVFALAAVRGFGRRFAYLNYTSLVDLILEVALGFGMVMLTMESLRRESETANRDLQAALRRLEELASTDPLTSALNRHAYQSLLARRGGAASDLAGCVAIADVNRLKEINDREGHVAGDLAIRRVATAIRSAIRADDLLFRWGGDEFLVILESLGEEEARRRLARVNEILAEPSPERGDGGEPALSVSFGIAPFGRAAALDAAIEQADALMYEGKRASAAR
ncbi:MAG TPA: GGDEF domain-containing protein [Thermoanaerobaculia bacterium]|nr:GGDEF domain-containing protein [Thermoanaerobaculia bacterium]